MKLRKRKITESSKQGKGEQPKPKKPRSGKAAPVQQKSASRSSKSTSTPSASNAALKSGGDEDAATSYPSFLSCIENKDRRQDFLTLHLLIRRLAPNLEPTTEFSHGIVGYGKYHYKYKSGREGDWVKINMSDNKANIAIHCCGLVDGEMVVQRFKDKLGKCSVGKSCVRFKKLSDLNLDALEDVIKAMATCDIMT